MGNSVSAGSEAPKPAVITTTTEPKATGDGPPPETKESPSVPESIGSIESLHQRPKELFPIPFEGAKIVVNRGLTPHFQVSHTMTMSNVDTSGYRFGVTYVGQTKFSESEVYPVLLGELYPNGNLNAQVIHQPTEHCRLKFIGQMQKQRFAAQQFSSEFRFNTWQLGLTAANPDLATNSVTVLTDFMKRITGQLSLGSMFLWQKNPQIPGGQMAMWTVGGKYGPADGKWQASISTSPLQLSAHAAYHIKVNEQLQLATEFETDYRTQSSVASIGYQYEIPRANVTVRAQVDSSWNIAATLEKKLLPFPFTFALCGAANQAKYKYNFGIGLIIG